MQVMEWPNEKYMVLNTDKCHHICSGRDTENSRFCFAGNAYTNRKEENILSIIINSAVLYDSHIKEVLRKVSLKLAVLSSLVNYLGAN